MARINHSATTSSSPGLGGTPQDQNRRSRTKRSSDTPPAQPKRYLQSSAIPHQSSNLRESVILEDSPSDDEETSGFNAYSEDEENEEPTPKRVKRDPDGRGREGTMAPPPRPNGARRDTSPNETQSTIEPPSSSTRAPRSSREPSLYRQVMTQTPTTANGARESSVASDATDNSVSTVGLNGDPKDLYDWEQSPEARRQIRANLRDINKEISNSRDDVEKADIQTAADLVMGMLQKTNTAFSNTKQTSDSTIDSDSLTQISSMWVANTKRHEGGSAVTIDVSEFSKLCARVSQNKSTEDLDDDDEEEASSQGIDFEWFGRNIAFPNIKRPPLSSFLLGPLSIQKKSRTITRRERQSRQAQVIATQPTQLRPPEKGAQQNQSHDIKQVVKSIGQVYMRHREFVEQSLGEDVIDQARLLEALSQYRVSLPAEEEEAYVSALRNNQDPPEIDPLVYLFDFVTNPHSFTQTVENLFYVSFLINNRNMGVEFNIKGEPLLRYYEEAREVTTGKHGSKRFQAILGMDMETWETCIKAYDIKEPMIPTRQYEEEGASMERGGWYGYEVANEGEGGEGNQAPQTTNGHQEDKDSDYEGLYR